MRFLLAAVLALAAALWLTRTHWVDSDRPDVESTQVGWAEAGATGPSGEVVHVGDGDSLRLRMPGGDTLEIRLAQIDAPELRQPYGHEAREALSARALGRRVTIEEVDRDSYGRVVAEVFVDGSHVNASLVRDGHAWANTRWARGPEVGALEREARAAERGLWALPAADRQPPWDWRRQHGRRRGPPDIASETTRGDARDPRCAAKRSCRAMTDCAEARALLRLCGLDHMDGDGDGLPCERGVCAR